MRMSMVLVLACLVAACGGRQEQVSQQEIERAANALAPLKKQLMAALTDGLERGPDSAIVVCKTQDLMRYGFIPRPMTGQEFNEQ